MDDEEAPRLQGRQLRAVALAALAVVAIAAAGIAYLKVPLPRIQLGSQAVVPQLSETVQDALDYNFVSPTVGWALDVRSAIPNAGGDFWIFRTTDGARHWTQQYRGKIFNAGYSRTMFFGAAGGFVAVGSPVQVVRTTDGGAHWMRVATPNAEFADVQFVDPSHGWLLAPFPMDRPRLYETSNGGDTWVPLADPPAGVIGLAMRSRSEGWLGGERSPASVFLSVDGGQTWQTRSLQLRGVSALGLPCAASVALLPGSAVMSLASCGFTGPDPYTSTDWGATWTELPFPPPNRTSIDRTTFVDAQHGWTMTGGVLWKTIDGGLTWRYWGIQIDNWDYSPHAIDSRHGWAELQPSGAIQPAFTGLALTSDGGTSWTQVSVPHP
jgi:photosystem II stability/assembly factor-like uncharacterized protein